MDIELKNYQEGLCPEHQILKQKIGTAAGRDWWTCPKCSLETETREQEEQVRQKRKEIEKRQAKINKELENSMLSPRFKDKTFENYEIESEKQKRTVDICIDFCLPENTNNPGLIMIGKSGTGKNHLASAIIKEWVVIQQKTALMTEAIKIIRKIKSTYGNREMSEEDVLKKFIAVDLLVILPVVLLVAR